MDFLKVEALVWADSKWNNGTVTSYTLPNVFLFGGNKI